MTVSSFQFKKSPVGLVLVSWGWSLYPGGGLCILGDLVSSDQDVYPPVCRTVQKSKRLYELEMTYGRALWTSNTERRIHQWINQQ